MKKIALLSLLLLPACDGFPPPTPTPTPSPTPPGEYPGWDCARPPALSGEVAVKGLPGRWTVTLRKGIVSKRLVSPQGVANVIEYETTVSASVSAGIAKKYRVTSLDAYVGGFSAVLDSETVAKLAADPAVRFLHASVPMHALPVEGRKVLGIPIRKMAGVPWGLDCITERDGCRHLDGLAEFGADGAGVHAVIIDTGVSSHPDFGGRLQADCFAVDGRCGFDDNGHATHVAGTVASRTYGVSKAALIHSARVLRNGSGTDADVIRGIRWAIGLKEQHPDWRMVINMSLGGDASPSLDAALCDANAAGIASAVAAGNDGPSADACQGSPARVRQALTVGAMSRQDEAASFSTLGTCVDLFAPGQDIESTWVGGGTNTISGTSMASPHVCGTAALFLARHPGATPAAVADGVAQLASRDLLSGTRTAPNLLLYAKEP